jgi:hypothetical protein
VTAVQDHGVDLDLEQERLQQERLQQERLCAQLQRRFPDAAAQLPDLVALGWQGFADARVRSYVPVLVERQVRTQLLHS